MNIILCVGLAKTGSTFLRQEVFPNCQDALVIEGSQQENNPIRELITYISNVQQECHDKYNAESFDNNIIDDYRIRIKEFLENFNEESIIISWPSFVGSFGGARDDFNSMPWIAEILSRIFGRVKVLLVIRKQDEYIYSLYSTYLKRGGQDTLDEFIEFNNASVKNNRIFIRPERCNWNHIYDTYKDKFDLFCIPYELSQLEPDKYYKDIFNFFDIQLPNIDQSRVNTGYTGASQEVNRKFSRLRSSIGKRILKVFGYASLSSMKDSLIEKGFYRTHKLIAYLEMVNIRRFLERHDKYLKLLKLFDRKKYFQKHYSNIIISMCGVANNDLDNKLKEYNLKELGYY